MAPGDLNLKKSWNPKLMKNQQKVWEKEQEALEERKRIQERQKEIEAERERQELKKLRLQRQQKGSNGVPLMPERIDWMYEHGSVEPSNKAGGAGADELAEADEPTKSSDDYLLGKKRLDDLILGNGIAGNSAAGESRDSGVDKNNKLESTLHVGNAKANTALLDQRELQKISKDDPMARIKLIQLQKQRQQQQAQVKSSSSSKVKNQRSNSVSTADEGHSKKSKSSHNNDRYHSSSSYRHRSPSHRNSSHRSSSYRSSSRHSIHRHDSSSGRTRTKESLLSSSTSSVSAMRDHEYHQYDEPNPRSDDRHYKEREQYRDSDYRKRSRNSEESGKHHEGHGETGTKKLQRSIPDYKRGPDIRYSSRS